jgi:hypothetical protein
MLPQIRPSDRVSVLGTIPPQSATTVQVTGWLDATVFHSLMAVVATGAISATGTVDAKMQQATSAAGAGAKDVTGKAITQLTQAGSGSNKQVLINLHQEDLDINNGYKWVQLSITPATAAALIDGKLLGFDPRNLPASAALNANASLAQVV